MIQKLKPIFFSAFALAIVMIACQKEFSFQNDIETTEPNTITSIAGRITNTDNEPVMGATVKAGTTTATTNINGEFTLQNANVNDKAAYITVHKDGYFTGSRTFIAKANTQHYIEIELLEKTQAGTVSAVSGGTAALSNGASVTLPANGVVKQSDNSIYSGNVNIAIAFIDPSSEKLHRQMPGDLRGIDANNNQQGLISYGMVAVELTADNGEKLQIATGKKATVKFPLPASMQASAPATIPLWSFDETKGLWKEEGAATKSGNGYTGEVSHFSWWNCDVPIPTATVSATFKDQNGNPLAWASVKVSVNNMFFYAHTDSSGNISGLAPANTTMSLSLFPYGSCGNYIQVQNIGPFTANSTNNLGVITVNIPTSNLIELSGVLKDCNGAIVSNGYIKLRYNWYSRNIPVDANGNFNYSISACSPSLGISFSGIDLSTNQEGSTTSQNYTIGSHNVGTITACGTNATEFFKVVVDGTTVHEIKPPSGNTYGGYQQQGWSGPMSYLYASAQNKWASLEIIQPTPVTGNYTIGYFGLKDLANNDSLGFSNNGQTVNITEYGAPNAGFIAGNFTGTATSYATSSNHSVNVTFRLRRQQ